MPDDGPPQVRPRQHILEDRSEAHFTLLTPEGWVTRPMPKDYGVDYEVEIFEVGRRTGLTFKVQLKSTDKAAAQFPVKVVDLEYWQTLDVPTLLVLYCASTGQVFSKWAHSHNPWPPLGVDQKTTTVYFLELYADHLTRIPRELDLVRQVRSRASQMPVCISIDHRNASLARGLRHVVRQAIDNYGLRSRIKIVAADPYLTVSFTEDAVVVAAPANVSSATAHGVTLTSLDELPTMPPTVFALVSILLAQVGSSKAAADVLLPPLPQITDDLVWMFAPGFAAVLAQDGRWSELLGLLDRVVIDPEVSEDTFLVALANAPAMPGEVARSFIDNGRMAAATFFKRGIPFLSAQRRFTCAQIGVQHGMWDDVNGDLGAAYDLLPEFYENDLLYHQLRGKSLWNLGQGASALPHYERAWQLGWRTDQAVAAFGEALIMAGRYEDARQHFDDVVASNALLMTRWATVLHYVVTHVIDITGLSVQARRMFEEDENLDALNECNDPDILMEALRTRDAFNPGLLSLHQRAAGTHSLGVLLWNAAHANDLGQWILAIGAAPRSGADEGVVRAIVECAVLEFPDVIDELARLADHPSDADFVDREYLEWAREVADAAEPYDGPQPLAGDELLASGRPRLLIPRDPEGMA